MNEKLSSYRLGGWLVVAMSGPFVYLAGRQNWTAILAAGAVCLLSCWTVFSLPANKLLSWRSACLLEYGSLVVACVVTSRWSSDIWPTGKGDPVVPLTLLVLATVSAWFGANRASKGVGVLFWLVTILYSILLAFGLRNVELSYLRPEWEEPRSLSLFLFLLPCAAQFLPREDKKVRNYIPVLLGTALLITLWTEGNLSLNAAKQVAWPFYKAGESVRLFGVANRLESFISVGATVGFYGLYSLLLGTAGYLAEQAKTGWGKYGVLMGGILYGVGVLIRWQIPDFVLVIGTFVLWIALPILGHIIPEKKCEKE